jgi:hypothetical protein
MLSVDTETDCELDDLGSIPCRSKRFYPQRSDLLKCPPSRLSNGCRGPFPRGKAVRGVKLTIYLHLMSRSMVSL